MKKLFLFLLIAGFAFASCGKKAATNPEVAPEECPETFVMEVEDIEFVDGEEIIDAEEVE